MKKALFILLLLTVGHARSSGQQTSGIVPDNPYYEQAYLEIASMLDGKTPLSIKRAVFLAEWAFYDGKLDYDHYCRSIDSASMFIKKFIAINQTDKYKTGKNLALTEYFFLPVV